MEDEMEILRRLLLKVVCRLEDYMVNGIPVPEPKLVVDVDDYRITSAEQRIEDRKRQIEKDKKFIKQIRAYLKRRKELQRKSRKSK